MSNVFLSFHFSIQFAIAKNDKMYQCQKRSVFLQFYFTCLKHIFERDHIFRKQKSGCPSHVHPQYKSSLNYKFSVFLRMLCLIKRHLFEEDILKRKHTLNKRKKQRFRKNKKWRELLKYIFKTERKKRILYKSIRNPGEN